MKRNVVVTFLNIVLGSLLFTVVAVYSVAQGQPTAGTGYPITIGVGQSVSICKTGTVICPVRSPICDDLSVATVRSGKDGLEIVGVKPGKTLCSVASATALRTIYTITVR
jgi:hypothetical protein